MVNILSSDYNLTYPVKPPKCQFCHRVVTKKARRIDCIDENDHEVTYHNYCWHRAIRI